MHLGSAPRIPCPLRRFVPGAVSCCRRRLCYLGLPMSTEDPLHCLLRYSYASILLPVAFFSACAFLGFLLLRLYVRMSTTLPSVVIYTGV